MTTSKRSEPDEPATAQSLTNAGRWGDTDERGAANHLTAEVVRAAVDLVRDGQVISLADEIRRDRVPVAPARAPVTHLMSLDGGDFAAGYTIKGSDHGVADDYIFMGCQGTTHVDALGHMWYGGKLYNGFSSDTVRSYGATRLGIENLRHLVSRGVFFDVPRMLGVDRLDPEYVITPGDLQACIPDPQSELRSGDIAVIRTGWRTMFDLDPARYYATSPGIGIEAARWLAGSDVAAVASDNIAIEVQTAHDTFEGGGPAPVSHLLLIRDCGIYLVELLNLEELANQLAASGRTDFLFIAAPLKILGGSGSPLNPLAIL